MSILRRKTITLKEVAQKMDVALFWQRQWMKELERINGRMQESDALRTDPDMHRIQDRCLKHIEIEGLKAEIYHEMMMEPEGGQYVIG